MQRKKVFISSVQSEFAAERQILFEYLISDALLGKFFEPFIFENIPALSVHPYAVFLNEVQKCDIYLGIFGEQYGYEDEDKICKFVDIAHRKRAFPFTEDANIKDVLIHLNLIKDERITNVALLLFGSRPQRFFITSEVKCAHFHGVKVSKPIPSYQVYKGDVFEMIENAVDFILSKINLYVGDRSKSVTVDVEYEIPKQAVTEAIVNAVAHRDYTSNGSVQVMLFADRLEVANPGSLPYELTIDKLYIAHRSIPANPLIAEAMYLRGTIERMGTGTEELANLCIEKGLKKPEFIQENDFKSVLYRSILTNTDKVNEKLGENRKVILNLMQQAPHVTIAEIAQKLSISETAVQNNIKKLKQLGFIERLGSDKGGQWKIIE